MAIGRRGFLKALGKGTVVGAAMATPAAYAGGVDLASGKDRTVQAFNFECTCARNLVATVPEKVDEIISLKCDCGTGWRFQWKGDHFVTYRTEKPPLNTVKPEQAYVDDETTMDYLKEWRHAGFK